MGTNLQRASNNREWIDDKPIGCGRYPEIARRAVRLPWRRL